MSNKAFMFQDYYDAWNSHDLGKILSFFNDACVYEDLATSVIRHGKEKVKRLLNDALSSVPDVSLKLTSVFATERHGAFEWIMTGTYARTSEIAKTQATGKSFSVRGVSIMELSNGKINRNSDYWNLVSLREQIGTT